MKTIEEKRESNRSKHRRYRLTNFNGYNDKKREYTKQWRRNTFRGRIVYIKGLIHLQTKLKYADIPFELAITKMLQMKIKNLLRDLKKDN